MTPRSTPRRGGEKSGLTRYGYGDAGALDAVLREVGFRDVQVRSLSLTMRFDDGESLVRMNSMALVGMSSTGKALSDAERQRVLEKIVDDSAPVLRTYTQGALVFELSTNLATARSWPHRGNAAA